MKSFRCIATSATLAGGEKDRRAVTDFSSALFDEKFEEDCLVMGQVVPVADFSQGTLHPDDYRLLAAAISRIPEKFLLIRIF